MLATHVASNPVLHSSSKPLIHAKANNLDKSILVTICHKKLGINTSLGSNTLYLILFLSFFIFIAYGSNANKSLTSENFYCEVCDKKLNGPIPYDVHLNSKAHKEELAIREEFNYQ